MSTDLLLRNEDAEQAVLAAMLIEPVAVTKARAVCTAADFFASSHRLLFAAMLEIAARGATVDPLTVASQLGGRGELEAAGGKNYLGFLVDAVPTAANVAYHAELVQACATRRRLLDTLESAKAAITTGAEESLAAIAGSVQAALSAAVTKDGRRGFGVVTGDEIIALADSLIQRREVTRAGRIVGVATGYPEIDDVVNGARPGELFVFGARPKCGKTALVLNMATNAILDDPALDNHVGFVSTEMTRDELLEGAGNNLARLTRSQTAAGRVVDADVARFATRLSGLAGRLHIDDEAFPTLEDVIARSIDLKARHPEITLLVVDYLQRVTKRLAGRRGDEEIAAVTSGIKSLAKALKIPIYAPAQVNYKETDKRENKAPTSADLQGASGFAQDANFLFLLHRPALFNPSPELAHVLQVELAESRRTAKFTARLDWHGELMGVDSLRRRERAQQLQHSAAAHATLSLTLPDRREA
jgi:replicative DNA helicase